MKWMTRLLMIHWHYFVHETVEFAKINFLTGKNASGKSTIIDALRLILLGDTSGSFFNKAASGKGNRTLAGYLRGELGDDEESGFKYLRDGRFTSYLALEARWAPRRLYRQTAPSLGGKSPFFVFSLLLTFFHYPLSTTHYPLLTPSS
jgi:predicted ATPase